MQLFFTASAGESLPRKLKKRVKKLQSWSLKEKSFFLICIIVLFNMKSD
jgi:hypothetical protein